MREHKYKIWDKVFNRFTDNFWLSQDGELGVFRDNRLLSPREGFEIVFYTGLKDRNGVEIYEGDIVHKEAHETWSVEYDEQHASFCVYNQLNSNRQIEAHTSNYEIYNIKGGGIAGAVEICEGKGFVCEVIGNIYENPELLTKDSTKEGKDAL